MQNKFLIVVFLSLVSGCSSSKSNSNSSSNTNGAGSETSKVSFAPDQRKPVTIDSPEQFQNVKSVDAQELDTDRFNSLVAVQSTASAEQVDQGAKEVLWSHLNPVALESNSSINGIIAADKLAKTEAAGASGGPPGQTGSFPGGFPGGGFPGVSPGAPPGGKTEGPMSVRLLRSMGAYDQVSRENNLPFWSSTEWVAMEPDVAGAIPIELKKWLPIEAGYPPTFASMNHSFGVWINAWPATWAGEKPYEYDNTGKNAKPRKLKKGEKAQLDSDGKPMTYFPVKDKAKMGYTTLDLLNQKVMGQYNWKAPIGAFPTLSPDGKRMVGMCPYKTWRLDSRMDIAHPPSEFCLSVFSIGKNDVDGWIELADSPRWLGFVSANVVAIYNRKPEGLIQFWDVEAMKMVRSVQLKTAFVKDPGDESAYLGAVSSTGKYLAVGTSHGIVMIDCTDARVVNTFSIPPTKPSKYTGLNFSRNGEYLYSIIDSNLTRWSLRTGLPELVIKSIKQSGPVIDCAVPNLLVLGNSRFATRLTSFHSGSPVANFDRPNSAIIETASGSEITSLPYHVLHDFGHGRWLVLADSSFVTEETIKPKTATLFPNDPIRYIGVVSSNSIDLKSLEMDAHMGFAQIRPVAPMLKSGSTKNLLPTKPDSNAKVPFRDFKLQVLDDQNAVLPTFAGWPIAFAEKVAAVLHFKMVQTNRGSRQEVWCQRVDVQTGAPVTAPYRLWAWKYPTDREVAAAEKFVGALSPDGKQLALSDICLKNRIDVFDETGQVLRSFTVDDRAESIQEMQWLRDDCLVLKRPKEILALNPFTTELLYRMKLDSELIDFGLDRSWMALPHSGGVLLADKVSGKSLKWLKSSLPGVCLALSVSPDHRKIAARVSSPLKPLADMQERLAKRKELEQSGMGESINSTFAPTHQTSMVLWDIDSEQFGILDKKPIETATPFQPTQMQWIGLSHLWLQGEGLFDIEMIALVGKRMQYETVVQGSPQTRGVEILRQSPDGRVWREVNDESHRFVRNASRSSYELVPAGFPYCEVFINRFTTGDRVLIQPDRALITPSKTGLSLTTEVFDTQTNQKLAQELMANAVYRGYSIKPKGFRMVLEGTLGEEKDKIKFKDSTMGIPKVDLVYQFLFPNGEKVLSTKFGHNYVPAGSKYLLKSDSQFIPRNADGVETYITNYLFDFQGLDPLRAMADEMFSGYTPLILASHVRIPTDSYLEVNGKYELLPLTLQLIGQFDTNRTVAKD